jgi:APA family basic amino acid/polyamine antiporter
VSEAPDNAAAGDGGEETRQPTTLKRAVGVPWLFAVIYSTVGFSIYFSLGVVADRGLALTPVVFLVAGLLFVLTTLTYMEGAVMFRERGGSSTFSRYAFNELVSFIAGWAILIDYLIVIALAAISVAHYLEPVSSNFAEPGYEVAIGGAVIALVAVLNILDIGGRRYRKLLAGFAIADVFLQVVVILVGAIVVMHPDRLTDQIDLFSSPSGVDLAYAAVVAMLAYAGIEASSNLAPDLRFEPKDLRRIISTGALAVPLIYAGMAAIALMAVPVHAGPHGPETALAGRYIEAPVLGVVSNYDPGWLSDIMRWTVAMIAAPVLVIAAYTSMLGVSRHIFTLAINRQIPSWLGKLGTVHETPYIAIIGSALIAFGLLVPTDVKLLAGIYAFGAMLAISIANLSILRLRMTEPHRERPFRIGANIRWRGAELPISALVAAVLSIAAFASVLAFHGHARWVGGGWMVFGLLGYVVYRGLIENTSLTKRVTVSAEALTKQVPELEYSRLLVPIFGTELDDDIISTAGRLAAADEDTSDDVPGAVMDVVYVVNIPMTLPLDANLPAERAEKARAALERAKEVGEEYESVEVHTQILHARSIGAGIVELARSTGAEAIVMGAEPPTKIRGGAVYGGKGAARPAEVGAATEYVLKKAPCQVLLTAPPAPTDDDGVAAAKHPSGDGRHAAKV